MALVFKIKFEDTLRRWVVSSEELNTSTFSLTLGQLHAKIRELFHLHPDASITITYVDQENDVVTLGDDQDLVDACLVQRLNPLRLHAQLNEEKPKQAPEENVNIETVLKALFPQATIETIKDFLQTNKQYIHSKLTTELLQNAEEAFKDVLRKLSVSGPQAKPNDKVASDSGTSAPLHPKERDSSGQERIHWGVECDGCGMYPIQGIRYKSTKKHDYDLCTICFDSTDNRGDYHKIDYPLLSRPFHGHWGQAPPTHYRPPYKRGPRQFPAPCPPVYRTPFTRGPYGWKPEPVPSQHHLPPFSVPVDDSKKMDARFVKDVTVFDGTEMAPGTEFTKIWRVSNIGTMAWPQGIQLVHIGGDSLCDQDVVNVEIPEHGLACGEDVDVSIDLMAPEKSGRYVSHWRLTTPAGQRFGQRLWVVIQVVPRDEESPQVEESLRTSDDERAKQNKTENIESGSGLPDLLNFENVSRSSETVVTKALEERAILYPQVENPVSGENQSLADEKFELVGIPSKIKATALSKEEEVSEVDGFSVIENPNQTIPVAPVIKEETNGSEVFNKTGSIEDTLLSSLESMGFANHNLNLLLLQKNNLNLDNTVEDLLSASGWDGALKDLEEMGFTDQVKNIRLLAKHGGSIKQVVKDLVKSEKKSA